MAGFGGTRCTGGELRFAPRLPEKFSRLAFTLPLRGRRVRVDIGRQSTVYTLLARPDLTIHHHGEPVLLHPEAPTTRPVPALRPDPAPEQSPHRQPNAHHGRWRRGEGARPHLVRVPLRAPGVSPSGGPWRRAGR
ncbi:glycosyl hydrolase family 65 protein [Streptomyces sp. WAC07061]|uniref:glycosyl hydrolase family 65 protein n=1 Tax=Streptomyces sp. WAC07061 TaxID=2487410 RepID=UPI0021AFB9BB|nr:glycosyl hydrolase family 65 protein [Streptomyces sp. WAC07061]